LSLIAVYILTRRISDSESVALGAVAASLTLPMIAAGGMFMTIDAPFTCLWAWALVFGYGAIFYRRQWAWPIVGLLVGLGILAKYTMLLWVCGLLLFLITTSYRREFLRRGVWIAAAIAGLCCIPIIIWNLQHDWITLRHVGVQSGATNFGIRWFGP